MSKFLKNIRDLEAFREAVRKCKGEVYLVKNDKTEQFNLKSTLSEYLGLAKLADNHGDEYEIFCQLPADEGNLLKYFFER